MTGDELKDFFINLVDDEEFDETHLWHLFNLAKNRLEREVKPAILITEDSTKSGAVGDTYTNTKALPSDFRAFWRMYYGTSRLRQVPFAEKYAYKDSPLRVFFDHKNAVFAQTGRVNKADTYHLFYIPKTTDFADANSGSAIVTWPSEFHTLIAFDAADIYQSGTDADELSFRMSASQEKEYRRIKNSFIDWDADLKQDANDDRIDWDDVSDVGIKIGDM